MTAQQPAAATDAAPRGRESERYSATSIRGDELLDDVVSALNVIESSPASPPGATPVSGTVERGFCGDGSEARPNSSSGGVDDVDADNKNKDALEDPDYAAAAAAAAEGLSKLDGTNIYDGGLLMDPPEGTVLISRAELEVR